MCHSLIHDHRHFKVYSHGLIHRLGCCKVYMLWHRLYHGHKCSDEYLLQSGLTCGHRCLKVYVLPCGLIHMSVIQWWLQFGLESQAVSSSCVISTETALTPWPSASPGTWLLSSHLQAKQSKVIGSRANSKKKKVSTNKPWTLTYSKASQASNNHRSLSISSTTALISLNLV